MATEGRSRAETRPATGADRPELEPPRPWPIYLVAALLVGFAALVAWSPFRHDEPVDAVDVCVAVFFLAVAVALLAWRRVGWWTAVVVLVPLVLFQVASTIGKPGGGNLVGCGYELTALGLLMLPSVRRHRSWVADVPATTAAAIAPGVPRPSGWTPEWLGGWFKCLGIGLAGLLSLLVGLGMLDAATSTSDGPSLPGALLVALTGLTLLSAVPLFWPIRRGRPTVEQVTVDGRPLPGLVFPYSRLRTSAGLVPCVGFLLAGVLLTVAPDPSGTHRSTAGLRVLGVVGVLVFGAFAGLALRRRNRRWKLIATPEVVGTVGAPVGGLVSWSAITSIEATETSTTTTGGRVHEPHIAVTVTSAEHIDQDAVDAAFTALGRHFADGDITFPVRALAVDPALTVATLQHYLAHPHDRPELADRRSEGRVSRRELDARSAPAAGQ